MDFWWALGAALLTIFTFTDWFVTKRVIGLAGTWNIEFNPLVRRWRMKGALLTNAAPFALVVAALFCTPFLYGVFFIAGMKLMATSANMITYSEMRKNLHGGEEGR